MQRKHIGVMVLLACFLAVMVMPLAAQDEIVVGGLVNPRNLSFDSEGNLYVAEAGNAGSLVTSSEEPYGPSGQITMVTPDGQASVVVNGLMSFRDGGSRGTSDVMAVGDSLWVLIGEVVAFENPFHTALVELDREYNRVKTFVDLWSIELNDDPDGNPNQESNPVDFDMAPDGTIYIAAAGCNCLLSWTPESGVQVVKAWSFADDNPVPTSVAVDAMGDVYVGFLTGFPFAPGSARVEKWSGGELVQTFTGYTAITGLVITDDGSIYAVETASEERLGGTGRVVQVTADGPVVVAEGLDRPYGIAQGPDGALYVTVGSRGASGGAVIRLPMAM